MDATWIMLLIVVTHFIRKHKCTSKFVSLFAGLLFCFLCFLSCFSHVCAKWQHINKKGSCFWMNLLYRLFVICYKNTFFCIMLCCCMISVCVFAANSDPVMITSPLRPEQIDCLSVYSKSTLLSWDWTKLASYVDAVIQTKSLVTKITSNNQTGASKNPKTKQKHLVPQPILLPHLSPNQITFNHKSNETCNKVLTSNTLWNSWWQTHHAMQSNHPPHQHPNTIPTQSILTFSFLHKLIFNTNHHNHPHYSLNPKPSCSLTKFNQTPHKSIHAVISIQNTNKHWSIHLF